jgi:hypothetical protein
MEHPNADLPRQPSLAWAVESLNNLRDALVQMSLALHDYQFQQGSVDCDAAAQQMQQLLEHAKARESPPPNEDR